MRKIKTLTAKNPSEARGIRKALKAAGVKFEFKSARKKRRPAKKRKRNPRPGDYHKPQTRRDVVRFLKSKSKSQRREILKELEGYVRPRKR